MTISSTTNRKEYTGDDATVAFSTSPVVFFDEGDLDVYVVVTATGVATLKTITTHYTVSGGDGSTGTVTMLTAPASTETLVIVRNLDATQATDFVNNDTSDAEVLEDALDKLTILVQQLDARLDRSFALADSDISGASTEIPTPVADGVIKWNAAGDELEAVEFSGLLPDDVAVSAYGETLVDDATEAAARATLGFPDIAAKGDLIAGSADDTLVKLAVGTDGYGLQALSGATSGLTYLPPAGPALINGYLDWSVSGNILTVTLKTLAGTDPSATDPVYLWMRHPTATDGEPVLKKIASTLSGGTTVALPDTATIGTANSVPFRLWCVLMSDSSASSGSLALINCLTGTAPNCSIYPLAGYGVASSTATGTGADSAGVFYADGTNSNFAYAVLGYATWEAGLATAGTWSAGPTRSQAYGPGVRLPGATVQLVREQTGAVATGTDVTVSDDSIPESSEGDEYIDVAITPSSAANLLRHRATWHGANTAGLTFIAHMHIDATVNAFAASDFRAESVDAIVQGTLEAVTLAAGTVAQTTNLLVGSITAGTTTFNGASGGRLLGGVLASYLEIEETMT